MHKRNSALSYLIGAISLSIGIAAFVRPQLLERLLGIDTGKPTGKALLTYLGVRDLAWPLLLPFFTRKPDTLRRAMTVRTLFEMGDIATLALVQDFVRQPQGRKAAGALVPMLALDVWLRQQEAKA